MLYTVGTNTCYTELNFWACFLICKKVYTRQNKDFFWFQMLLSYKDAKE